MASIIKVSEILHPTSNVPSLTINSDSTVSFDAGILSVTGPINGVIGANTPYSGTFTDLSYSGTLTGNTGIINIGSGQFYKDVNGQIGIGTSSPTEKLDVSGNVKVSGSLSVAGNNISSQTGFKNRIINGAMTIDQRNAGASITFNDAVFVVDRFGSACSQTSKATAQQSTTAPVGFINSIQITSSSAYSVLAGDFFNLYQNIEGLNVFDFGWGTANAQPITISFWVRSSLTGTFGGSISNSGLSRSYPFTYTISAANTYEYKTVTIPGDTSGTWLTTNGIGLRVYFGLGVGTTYSGTAGAWAATRYQSATGATSVVGTSGATFYITGVQLEKGSTATPFEFRSIGQELGLCQRYFEKSYLQSVVPGVVTTQGLRVANLGSPTIGNSAGFFVGSVFGVTKRAAPTVTIYSYQGNSGRMSTGAGIGIELAAGTGTASAISQNSFAVDNLSGTQATITDNAIVFHFTASAEL
jgi:hypothetical protein